MKKHCFLTLFGEHNAESSKNAVFRKREKTLFCHTFWGTSRKKLKNAIVFRIFCELCTKCLEKREKTQFSHNFCWMSRKKLKNRCFSAYFAKLWTKCLSKTWINTVSSHFLGNVAQKAQKTLFFAFFANFVQSVSKNVKKHCFLTLFAECRK